MVRRNLVHLLSGVLLLFAFCFSAVGQPHDRPLQIAFLDLGSSETSRRVADQMSQSLAAETSGIRIFDRDQANAAARGAGYTGSLNLTLEEARNVGAAIGCDYFFTGGAQTLRRSPSEGPAYFESYAALFLVSARTGKLAFWERQEFRQPTAVEAERALLASLTAKATRTRFQDTIRRVGEEERLARATAFDRSTPVIESMPEDETDGGVRVPRPFRRPKPPYPEEAARDAVEATVDVLVDIDAKGKVGDIQVVRWAGYRLDESVINTVKQMDFFPAMRDGVAVPMRVLLRYNFRKPPPAQNN